MHPSQTEHRHATRIVMLACWRNWPIHSRACTRGGIGRSVLYLSPSRKQPSIYYIKEGFAQSADPTSHVRLYNGEPLKTVRSVGSANYVFPKDFAQTCYFLIFSSIDCSKFLSDSTLSNFSLTSFSSINASMLLI